MSSWGSCSADRDHAACAFALTILDVSCSRFVGLLHLLHVVVDNEPMLFLIQVLCRKSQKNSKDLSQADVSSSTINLYDQKQVASVPVETSFSPSGGRDSTGSIPDLNLQHGHMGRSGMSCRFIS